MVVVVGNVCFGKFTNSVRLCSTECCLLTLLLPRCAVAAVQAVAPEAQVRMCMQQLHANSLIEHPKFTSNNEA